MLQARALLNGVNYTISTQVTHHLNTIITLTGFHASFASIILPHQLSSQNGQSCVQCNITTPPPHHKRLRPFFQDHPGKPVPEENFWTLWCKRRLTEADTLTIRLGATPSGLTSAHLHHPPIFFYGPDALPAAQPTASKH